MELADAAEGQGRQLEAVREPKTHVRYTEITLAVQAARQRAHR
jgi:hypothetical protein